jgi:opacity protein-like surface antigen
MKRTLIASALLAGAALTAGDLSAQASKNAGFMLNAHLSGNSIQWDLGEIDPDAETDAETGGGFGVGLGYGFGERFAVIVNLDAATVSYPDDNEDDGERALVHFDIGGRFNFGSTASALRPYVNAAITGVAEGEGEGDEQVLVSGSGFSVGGGLQYFFTPSLALDAGLQGTFGNFTEVTLGDESTELDEDISFTTARLQLGVTWHP